MDWLDDLVARFVTDDDDAALAVAHALTMAGTGADAAEAYLELCRLVGESASEQAELLAALDDVEASGTLDLIGLLIIACFAAIRADYAARQDAQAARKRVAAWGEQVVVPAGEAYGADMQLFLQGLVGETVIQISTLAATRAPLVRVETGVSLPSSVIAWHLYGDPARGEELVARNASGTPLLMPSRLEALAS